MMRSWSGRADQTGDTIVEVLIAIAVVSSVLMGAFLVAQKSATAVRDSQEHGEMLQLLQGQIELVRSVALTQNNDISGVYSTASKYFCMNGTTPVAIPGLGSSLPPLAAADFTKYGATCGNLQGRYNVAGYYDSSSKVFYFDGRWDRVNGGRNEEQMAYRVYPGM